MFDGMNILCFASCYAAALVAEIWAVARRRTKRRWTTLVLACVGVVAHTLHLGYRASVADASPLSSPYDWYLLAAWVLAVLFLGLALYFPKSAMGLFVLPPVLALSGAAWLADQQPFAIERAHRFWGGVHGTFLLLGTVTVLVGFIAGVMYLVQSYRLKHKVLSSQGFRLPSLEWLERINSRSLAMSVLLIGVGFGSGVILNEIKHESDAGYLPWTDPVVLSLAAMLVWLIGAELFRLGYRPARGGRKVAYLTVASFVFLAISLASMLLVETEHRPAKRGETNSAVRRPKQNDPRRVTLARFGDVKSDAIGQGGTP